MRVLTIACGIAFALGPASASDTVQCVTTQGECVEVLAVVPCLLRVREYVTGTESPHNTRLSGTMTIEVHPEWSPLGASRFMELVDDNFFDDMLFYRYVRCYGRGGKSS